LIDLCFRVADTTSQPEEAAFLYSYLDQLDTAFMTPRPMSWTVLELSHPKSVAYHNAHGNQVANFPAIVQGFQREIYLRTGQVIGRSLSTPNGLKVIGRSLP
jgi:hypothetical protein